MLLDETEIQVDLHYMGPGKGSRMYVRCDALGVSKEVDRSNELQAKSAIFGDIEQLAHERFLTGEFKFPPPRQDKALHFSQVSNVELIGHAFSEDHFVRSFVRFELIRRNLFDAALYHLGICSKGTTRALAVELLKQRASLLSNAPREP